MGHLGRLKEQYRDLVARLDRAPVSLPEAADEAAEAARREILEILYSPEEAALAARMPFRPMSPRGWGSPWTRSGGASSRCASAAS